MKFISRFCLLLAVVFTLSLINLPAHALNTDAAVVSGCHSIDAQRPLMEEEKLLDTAQAVLVYERKSDTLIYSYHCDDKLYPSSMVKIMTALVAIENGNLTDTVTVTREALSYVDIGSVSAGLKSGEEISLEALLYCLLPYSANDAATVIAQHIGGSQEGFVQMMNDKALALGCNGTHFSNPHGLHDEQTYSTLRDICKILDAALDNETFAAIFNAVSYTVPATNLSEERELVTSNNMADPKSKYYDERVVGGKTGKTEKDGRCLAVTATGNDMELLAFVMGAKPAYQDDGTVKRYGSFEEMKLLLDHTFSQYTYRQVFYAGQAVSQCSVTNGSNNAVLAPVKTMSTVLPLEFDPEQLSWVYGDLTASAQAPIEKGQKMSALQVWYGDICVAQTDLVAMYAVPVYEKPVDLEIVQPNQGGNAAIWWILLGLFLFALTGGLVYLLVRRIQHWLIRRRRIRRRRQQRKR